MENKYKSGPLAQNRAEELGFDLWEHFVVPPFYEKLDLLNATKPRIIIGGRGCGKTMLLRYVSHQSMFSPSRTDISINSFSHIGLYWRIDTQFASALTKRNIEQDVWLAAFEHMASLLIGIELISSLENIARSQFEGFGPKELEKVQINNIDIYDASLSISLASLKNEFRNKLKQFQVWVNNVRTVQAPLFLPKALVNTMIEEIQMQVPFLRCSTFYVYLDEYENLLIEQQKLINTWLKHSEVPLIFNLAMKRNAFKERATTGNEQLTDIHDFRQIDLEDFEQSDFDLFAAEILFFRLEKSGVKNLPINTSILRDPDKVTERKSKEYRGNVLGEARKMFPTLTQNELASHVINDKSLSIKLSNDIEKALKRRGLKLSPGLFMIPEFPEISIIVPALLYRRRLNVDTVLGEIKKCKEHKPNKFYGTTDWVKNNFIGSLILFYDSLSRVCPIYSGYDTFCMMSQGNIRHFLELCHKSLSKSSFTAGSKSKSYIKPIDQAEAAKQASIAFLNEIKSCGKLGNRLHTFVLRLGGLFHLSHKILTQSEPEQTHFSITSGKKPLDFDTKELLSEAVKWSVLYEEKSTKQKSTSTPDDVEYVLNPIYSPYFNISYRKKRKLELNIDEVDGLANGSVDEYEMLLKKYKKQWSIDLPEIPLTLFSNLNLSE